MNWRKSATALFVLSSLLLLGFDIKKPLPEIEPSYSLNLYIPEPQVEILEAIPMRVTFYNPVPRQTEGDPNISSCGPNEPRQVALSRDWFFYNGVKHLCGTEVTVVTHDGLVFEKYVINDTMNNRFTNSVDVMLPHTDESEAFRLGVKQGYIIFN